MIKERIETFLIKLSERGGYMTMRDYNELHSLIEILSHMGKEQEMDFHDVQRKEAA